MLPQCVSLSLGLENSPLLNRQDQKPYADVIIGVVIIERAWHLHLCKKMARSNLTMTLLSRPPNHLT